MSALGKMTPPEQYDPNIERDDFIEGLGAPVDLGPITHDELVRAILEHTGTVIRRMIDSEWTIVSQESDYVAWVDALGFHADEDGEGRLVFYDKEEIVWNPIRKTYLVKPHSVGDVGIPEEGTTITRYMGGFSIVTPEGETVWFCLWHDVYHQTESGDLAPGLGPFRAEVRRVEDA